MCLYPKNIKNKKYTPNQKNGGIIPECKDQRVRTIPAPCGKCMECRKKKSREWAVRLHEELRTSTNGKFITFSLDDKSIIELTKEVKRIRKEDGKEKLFGYKMDNAVAKLATKRFLERWRKTEKKSVKHWFITELGQTNTERIHIHGILWTDKTTEFIEQKWKYGNIWIGDYVNGKTINYIVKYVSKMDLKHPNYIGVVLTTPGIGKNYLNRQDSKRNKYNGNDTIETYTTLQGIKLPLPTYYKNKIYTDDEKELLWIKKLDMNKRYVCGEEITINNDEDLQDYWKLVKYYRKINKKLGYGDNNTKREMLEEENNRREELANLRNKGIKIKTEKELPKLTWADAF